MASLLATTRSPTSPSVRVAQRNKKHRRQRIRKLIVEQLEERTMLALTITTPAIGSWVSAGPAGIANGQLEGVTNETGRANPTTGAVRAIAVQADNAATTTFDESKIVYAGSVNGGVWRTKDILANNVQWVPLTDHLPSSAIGAIAISPVNGNIAYAGTGKFSSFGLTSAPPVGLYRTVDGNKLDGEPTWVHLNSMLEVGDPNPKNIFDDLPITSIALSPTDSSVILVATAGARPGLFRSSDGGATWTYLSGNATSSLPNGTVTDVAYAPNSNTVFAAAITAREFSLFGVLPFTEPNNADLFVSSDGGATWESTELPALPGFEVDNVRIALQRGTDETIVYTGVVKNGQLSSLDRFAWPDPVDGELQIGSWVGVNLPPQIHPGKQGAKHFSIAASDPNTLILGGDRQDNQTDNGCSNYVGNLQLGVFDPNTAEEINTAWLAPVCSNAAGSAPHADSRDLEFIPGHPDMLLQSDDGGIYALTGANTQNSKKWVSKNGNLQLSEVASVTYNTTDDRIYAGLQDNSIIQQNGDGTWSVIQKGLKPNGDPKYHGGDGIVVATDPSDPRMLTAIVNNAQSIYQIGYDSAGAVLDLQPADTDQSRYVYLTKLSTDDFAFDGAGNFPFAYHNTDPSRTFIGRDGFYELIPGKFAGTFEAALIEAKAPKTSRANNVTAFAVGTAAEPNVAYIARYNNIAVRRPGESTISPTYIAGDTYCSGTTLTAAFTGFYTGAGYVNDIRINPDNWQEAYAVTFGETVYQTTDGGTCWKQIPIPAGRRMYSLEIVNPTNLLGDEILVVGTDDGILRSRRSSGAIVGFTSVATGLPNVIVNDLLYDPSDDLLVAATVGRGIWTLPNATDALQGETIVQGTSAAETIGLEIQLLGGKPKAVISLDGVPQEFIDIEGNGVLRIQGEGGADRFVIDNTFRFIGDATSPRDPLFIEIDGGEAPVGTTDPVDDIQILPPPANKSVVSVVRTPVNESGGVLLVDTGNLVSISIRYVGIESPVDNQIPAFTIASVGFGIQTVADELGKFANGPLEGLAPELLAMTNAERQTRNDRVLRTFAPDGAAQHFGDVAYQSTPSNSVPLLRRLIESGKNGFRLSEVGKSITTNDQLRSALDALDDVAGNVTVTTLSTGNGPQTRFDVGIEKTLFGAVVLDAIAQTGVVSLEVEAELFADIKARFVVGFDSLGFFIDPNPLDANGDPLGPEISVRNIRGAIQGDAILGPIEVIVSNGQLVTDSDLRLNINLALPANDTSSDGLLRLRTFLEQSINELVQVEMVGDPLDSTPDISISGEFSVSAFSFEDVINTKLTLEWPDASNLANGSVRLTDTTSSSRILSFLNAHADEFVAGVKTIAGSIEQATGIDLLDKKLPLIDKTLGELLDSDPEPLLLNLNQIATQTTQVLDENDRIANIGVSSINLIKLGIEAGNQVEYKNTSGITLTKTISEVSNDSFRFEFSNLQNQAPANNTTFQIKRDGGLASRLRSMFGSVDFKIPTFQQLIRELERVTGIELMDRVKLVGTPGSSDFAIHIPLEFEPDPIRYQLPISFKDKLPNLDLDASAKLELSVAPRFNLTIGVRLATAQANGSPIPIGERVFIVASKDDVAPPTSSPQPTGKPIVELDLTARLNDPELNGQFGFLNVRLAELRVPGAPADDPTTPIDEDGNHGISFSLHTTLDLQDPDTGTADQRITFVDLATKLANTAKFGIDGTLDIDGLKVVASVGQSFELGNVVVSLDGSGPNSNGHIDSFDDFARILTNRDTGIQVDGELTVLDSFRNITAEQVFAALDFLIEKLRDLGVGTALDKPIPLLNRSVSDLVDLGEAFSKTIGKPDSPNAISNAKAFENFINTKLGNPNPPISVEVTKSGIEFNFKLSHRFQPLAVPLTFTVGDGGISISGDGNLSVNACVAMELTLGISNAEGLAFADRVYLNVGKSSTPELAFELLVNAGYNVVSQCGGTNVNAQGAIDFEAAVGPLALEIEDARVLLDIDVQVNLATPANDGHVTITNILSTTIVPSFAGSIQGIIPIDGNKDNVVASLPGPNSPDARVEFAGRIDSLGGINFSFLADPGSANDIPHQSNPSTPLSAQQLTAISGSLGTIKIVSHNLVGLISNNFLNFGTLIEGLEKLIEWVDRVFGRDILDRKIPFVGKTIGEALNFLESDEPSAKSFRSIINKIISNRKGTDGTDSLGANLSDAAVQKALDIISDAIFSLGNIVPPVDRNNDGVKNARDLAFKDIVDGKTVGVSFQFKYQPSFSYSVPFDLGIDFLDFNAAGRVNVVAGLDLNLGFGINKSEGFFFLLDPNAPEFSINASVDAQLETAAKFGFLNVMASLEKGTNMSASFSADITPPSPNNRLRFTDLINPSNITQLIPNENLRVNIEAHVIALLATDINPELPSMSSTLILDWGKVDGNQGDGFSPFNILVENISPSIRLTKIELDVGSFVNSIVTPIFQKIAELNLVPERLLNALNTEIPLLKKKVVDLLEDVLKPEQQAAFDLVFRVASFIQDASTAGNDASDKRLVIHFPDIVIGRDSENPESAEPTPQGSDTAGSITQVGKPEAPLPADKEDKNGNKIPGSGLPLIGDLLTKLGEMGITFPVLRLSNLMQMLVGNDLDIVFVNVKPLELKKEFNQSFPLVGGGIGSIAELAINAYIGGGFTLTANISGGFDTSGLKNGRFLDGFYLGDFDPGENGQIDPTDEERPEIEFTGFVQAGIEGVARVAGFELGQISGYFKLEAGIGVELNDDNEVDGVVPLCDLRPVEERTDGKVHLGEMRTIASSHDGMFLSNFELTGGITAELGVHILILGGLILDRTESVKFDLLTFDGRSFPVKCVPTGGGGGESCSSGPNLGDLNFDLTTDTYTIELPPSIQLDNDPLDDLLISAEDLNGNPTDGFELGSYLDTDLNIGFTPDIVQISGIGQNIDFLSDGIETGQGATITVNGTLTQGVITNVTANVIQVRPLNLNAATVPRARGDGEGFSGLKVNTGLETFVLEGRGNIEMFGPSQCGANQIDESKGEVAEVATSDEVVGLGDGDNTVTIADKNRTPVKIKGGRGNDRIIGGLGTAEFHGGIGNDILIPGTGPIQFGSTPSNVKLFGGPGRDSLQGGRGNDFLVGGPGDDSILDAPAGNGVPFGLSGNDHVVGGGGKDRILSTDGNDIVVGDYDETLDPRPIASRDQAEDADTITSSLGGKTFIFSSNHGTQANQRGPAPSASRPMGDRVSAADPTDEIFAEREDNLDNVNQASLIRIQARQQSVVISSNSFSMGTGRSTSIAPNAKIEISDSSGIVNFVGSDANDQVTIAKSATGHVFTIANRSVITVLGTVVSIRMSGGGGSDTLELDFSTGSPIPIEGVVFDGGTAGSTGDILDLVGDNVSQAIVNPSNRTARSGSVAIGARQLSFVNTAQLHLSRVAALTWNSPGGADVLLVGNSTFERQAVTSISTKSKIVATPVLFNDITTLNINTGQLDSTTTGDQIIFASTGFARPGLKNVLISTGAANDSVKIPMEFIALPVSGGAFVVDGGTGIDSVEATGNVDMVLNGDLMTLANGSGNSFQLQNMTGENVKLIGGASANRFTVTNWTGNATVDGGASSDTLVLAMRGGSLTAVDVLTLAGNVTTTAASVPATVSGSFLLGTATRTLSVANGTASPDMLWNGSLGGAVGIAKTGLGSIQFVQPTTYTGTTIISSGELVFQGAQGVGVVTVNGGILSGASSIGALSVSSGDVHPGATTGITNVRGPLTLTSTARAVFQINGTVAGSSTTGYDVLDVDGTVNLGNSTLVTSVGFSSSLGNVFTIIDNDGSDAILGTFAGLAEGATLVANGFTYRISYVGGTGNDVTLTHIRNLAPAFQNRTITPQIDEGGEVILAGRITEPDAGDLFTLYVEWGDGTVGENYQFDPALGVNISVRHRYLDNSVSANDDPIDVFVLWHDQHGASNSTTIQTRVKNTTPIVTQSIDVPSLQKGRLLGIGHFDDHGVDSWTGMIDYGDGSGIEVLHLASDRTFALNHVYSTTGLYDVVVTIADDDGAVGESRLPIRIEDDGNQLYGVTWNNSNSPFDVDNDGFVAPIDVLLIINEANSKGFRNVTNLVSEFDLQNPRYFDTNADGTFSPLDALIVINFLNARQNNQVEGEGEGAIQFPIQSPDQYVQGKLHADLRTIGRKFEHFWAKSLESIAIEERSAKNETRPQVVSAYKRSRGLESKRVDLDVIDTALDAWLEEFESPTLMDLG